MRMEIEKPDKPYYVVTTLRITESDLADLQVRAIQEDRSVSAVIRRAIAQYLARESAR